MLSRPNIHNKQYRSKIYKPVEIFNARQMCTWFCCVLCRSGYIISSLAFMGLICSHRPGLLHWYSGAPAMERFIECHWCIRERQGLTHWGRVTRIWASQHTTIVSYNGLSPVRRQAIIWTNYGILLIRFLGTNFIEVLIEVHGFPFNDMHLKMSCVKRRPFYLDLNVIIDLYHTATKYRNTLSTTNISKRHWYFPYTYVKLQNLT